MRDDNAATGLNPAFRRLVHDVSEPAGAGEPPQLSLDSHAHRIILLAGIHQGICSSRSTWPQRAWPWSITEMMRPFVVTVMHTDDGEMGHM